MRLAPRARAMVSANSYTTQSRNLLEKCTAGFGAMPFTSLPRLMLPPCAREVARTPQGDASDPGPAYIIRADFTPSTTRGFELLCRATKAVLSFNPPST